MKKSVLTILTLLFLTTFATALEYKPGKKHLNKEGVVGLLLYLNGSMIEHVFKPNISACMKSKRIAQRIIFDNSPETIDEEPYKVLLEFIKSRWLSNDFKSPWITIPNALREIEKFEEQEEQKIFEGY